MNLFIYQYIFLSIFSLSTSCRFNLKIYPLWFGPLRFLFPGNRKSLRALIIWAGVTQDVEISRNKEKWGHFTLARFILKLILA